MASMISLLIMYNFFYSTYWFLLSTITDFFHPSYRIRLHLQSHHYALNCPFGSICLLHLTLVKRIVLESSDTEHSSTFSSLVVPSVDLQSHLIFLWSSKGAPVSWSLIVHSNFNVWWDIHKRHEGIIDFKFFAHLPWKRIYWTWSILHFIPIMLFMSYFVAVYWTTPPTW